MQRQQKRCSKGPHSAPSEFEPGPRPGEMARGGLHKAAPLLRLCCIALGLALALGGVPGAHGARQLQQQGSTNPAGLRQRGGRGRGRAGPLRPLDGVPAVYRTPRVLQQSQDFIKPLKLHPMRSPAPEPTPAFQNARAEETRLEKRASEPGEEMPSGPGVVVNKPEGIYETAEEILGAPGNATSANATSANATSARPAGQARAWPGLQGSSAGEVVYGGGPLLTSHIKIYIIFYGDWPYGPAGQRALAGFVRSLTDDNLDSEGPTVHRWWKMATQYKDAQGRPVSSKVDIGKVLYMNESYSKQIYDGSDGTNNDIYSLVSDSISSKKLPLDPDGLYMVMTSADVKVGSAQGGFCGYPMGYCGWHTQGDVGGTPVRFAFVGDGTKQCNDGCGSNGGYGKTANGYYGMDSLMSIFAHELVETATNPDTTSGYTAVDADGVTKWENADLCNGMYADDKYDVQVVGTTTEDSYAYNLLGSNGLKFLIQTNVDLNTQTCVLQAMESPPSPSPLSPAPSTLLSPPAGESTSAENSTTATSPSPPSPESGQVGTPDAACLGSDYATCSSCTGPDGCMCFQGNCLPYCTAVAQSGFVQQCSSCGSYVCWCSADGQCRSPFQRILGN